MINYMKLYSRDTKGNCLIYKQLRQLLLVKEFSEGSKEERYCKKLAALLQSSSVVPD